MRGQVQLSQMVKLKLVWRILVRQLIPMLTVLESPVQQSSADQELEEYTALSFRYPAPGAFENADRSYSMPLPLNANCCSKLLWLST